MNSDKPRISVIIPAYNVEQYIEAALDSVFAQEVPAYEVIVVNDGSTDSTLEKIAGYDHRPELTVVTTGNRGLGAARNEGLRHASGDYTYFFDADDLIGQTFISTINATIAAHDDTELVLFSGDSVSDEGEKGVSSNAFLRPFAAHGLSGDEAVARLVQAGTPSPSACLYVSKNSLWENNKLAFKPIIHEDDEMFLQLLLCARRVSVVQDVLFHRRIRAMSIMTSGLSAKNANGLFQVTRTLSRLYEGSTNRPAATQRAIKKRAIRTAQRYARVCRKIGMATDTVAILYWATQLRSPSLAMLWFFRSITKQT